MIISVTLPFQTSGRAILKRRDILLMPSFGESDGVSFVHWLHSLCGVYRLESVVMLSEFVLLLTTLQCCDTVGWVAGKASGLQKT